MLFLPAVYFSFISITTIGYGEICPSPKGIFETLVIIAYLASGIVVMFTLFGSLSEMIRKIHYMNRKFTGATEVQVWFGGTRLSIGELVYLVASQFNVSPERFCEVLSELDDIVRFATTHNNESITNLLDNSESYSQPLNTEECKRSTESSLENTKTQPNYQKNHQASYSSRFEENEHEVMIRALSTLYHLTLKGNCTFQSPKKPRSLLHISTNSGNTSSLATKRYEHGPVRKCSRFNVINLEENSPNESSGINKQ